MRIKEISDYVGLPISTLHYYERIGLVIPNRGDNKYRNYSEDDVENLILISIMKEYDFTIQEIKEVMIRYRDKNSDPAALEEARDFFYRKIRSIEKRISEYQEVISIIKSFPLLANAESELPKKKEDSLSLAYNLHKKILDSKPSTVEKDK